MEKDRALTREETAQRLGLSPLSLFSAEFRARIGLRALKIGRCLRFRESDVDRILAASAESDQEGQAR